MGPVFEKEFDKKLQFDLGYADGAINFKLLCSIGNRKAKKMGLFAIPADIEEAMKNTSQHL